jgi:hypothetical protein
MKTRAAVLAVALLAGMLSACDPGDVPNRASASEGDKALCVYINSLKVGQNTLLGGRYYNSVLVENATDGVLIGLTYALGSVTEAAAKNAVTRRCREIGAL